MKFVKRRIVRNAMAERSAPAGDRGGQAGELVRAHPYLMKLSVGARARLRVLLLNGQDSYSHGYYGEVGYESVNYIISRIPACLTF